MFEKWDDDLLFKELLMSMTVTIGRKCNIGIIPRKKRESERKDALKILRIEEQGHLICSPQLLCLFFHM